MPRHLGFYAAVTLGGLAAVVTFVVTPPMAVVIGVNVFFLVYLGFIALMLHKLTPEFLRKHAAEEDAPAPIILMVTAGAVVVSAVSLFLVMAGGEGAKPAALTLGVASVVLGWFAIHTMWAMHYAYEYYDVAETTSKARKQGIVGGLDFPGEDEPDGTAFLYFSYVLGATAQTADTNVTSNAMRRLVLLHGVFSFFFNTVLVAAAVNIVVSLAQ
jgi:uncharacterized membrane protein